MSRRWDRHGARGVADRVGKNPGASADGRAAASLGTWRWALRQGAFVLAFVPVLGLLGAAAAGASPTAAVPADPAALEREVVRGLVEGRDATGALLLLRRDGRTSSRGSSIHRSKGDGAAVVEALERLAESRPTARSVEPDPQPDPSLATAADPWTGFLAADLLLQDAFDDVGRRLVEAEAAPQMLQRLEAARERYRATVGALREAGPGAARLRAAELLEPPAPRVLGVGDLPFRRPALAPRPPRTAPVLLPVYLDPADPAPTAADRAASPAAPLAEDVVAQARELDFDAVRIYQFVRNGVATELYAGGRQGALGTLSRRAGNDVDQAALLVALLRASSVPARFVHGVVELPVEAVAADLGIPASRVPAALALAGVAHAPVIRGGRVAAVQVEHTWVAARVPYGNYRGTLVDSSAPSWVPLAPALKSHRRDPSSGVLVRMELAADAVLDHFLASPRGELPLEWLRREVESWLEEEAPGETYQQQLGSRTVEPLHLGLLPSTLPVRVVAVTGEAPTLAPEHLQALRVVIRSASGAVLLDHALPLHRVEGRRLTLSSMPATVDDDRVVNLFGGLDAVPAYLVRLRPRLRLDGRLLAVGEGDGAMGEEQTVELTLTGPWGAETVERRRLAGAYHALTVGSWRAPRPAAGEGGFESLEDDSESQAAAVLATLGARFCDRWGAAEDELAGLLDVALVRPWPSVAVVTDEVSVAVVGGVPLELDWRGVSLDALLRAAEPVARAAGGETGGGGAGAEAAARERDWMRLAALQGSALEHRVFEDGLLVESISADKGLAFARQAGLEVVTVDATNLDLQLPSLAAHPAVVRDDVARRVGLGLVVEIPRQPIALADWRGSVWRAEDPATGGAGYFLAGGLAGGATAEAPGSWVLQLVAQALAAPYSSDPNPDPGAGVRISKVLETDRQQGTVGEHLDKDLTVRVTDALGRPVQGAPVVFRVGSGGGHLLDGADPTALLEVRTDRLGLASAPLVLGTDTNRDPVYVQGPADAFHPTRAGANLVEAVASSAGGELVLDGPFVALAYPGPAATMRRTNGDETRFAGDRVAVWVDTLAVVVEDGYGNPVSNQTLRFSTSIDSTDTECLNAPLEPIAPAAVFEVARCPVEVPRLGDCGSRETVVHTGPQGVSVGVILGDSVVSSYAVEVAHDDLPPLSYLYQTLYQLFPSGRCFQVRDVMVEGVQSTNAEGEALNAAEVSTAFAEPVGAHLYYWVPDRISVVGSDGEPSVESLAQGSWAKTTASSVQFTVGGGGSALPAVLDETTRAYETLVRVGPEPGVNDVAVRVEGLQILYSRVDPVTLEVVETWWEEWPHPLEQDLLEIWGLRPRITEVLPDPIPLTDDGRSAGEVVVRYDVEPAAYRAARADVLLYAGDRVEGNTIGSSRSGSGTATTQRGFPFDPGRRYTAQLVLNTGSASEVRSPAVELPLTQRLFRDVSPSLVLSQEVDLVNRRTCPRPDVFRFALNQEAQVRLVLRGVERRPDGGTTPDGSEYTLIADETRPPGDHAEPLTVADVPPGEYEYVLTGTAADGIGEERRGLVRSLYRERDDLPLGHVLVDGVDLFDGHLTLSRTDFELPGRGLPLSLSRTWSSGSAAEGGPLGPGWTHNWDSSVVVTPCGEAIVLGGDGSGARFVDDGAGGLRPLRGYHGSLVADPEALTFDYFTKAGVRYHYRPGSGRWLLDHVEDPSGNRTRLTYEGSALEPGGLRLAAVEDASGRRLRFRWEVLSTVRGPVESIVAVEGPAGLRMDFDYDDWGHPVRAAREPHAGGLPSRVESYAWELRPENAFDDLHVLASVRDEVGGGTTRYAWQRGAIGVQGNVVVPRLFVTSVTRPEGGELRFAYQPEALASREPATVEVAVTDPRGESTTYLLNQHGAAVEVRDPVGAVTRMEWAPDDALMTARIDANGTRTDLTYDEHGNLLSESVGIGSGSDRRTLVRSRTYHPPDRFDPPYVKDRVATRTDRTGATTTYSWDRAGRLLREEIRVTGIDGGAPRPVATERTWLPNGDLASQTGPRGYTTRYTWDAYGNPLTSTDPLGGVTASAWDVRGRLLSRTDPLGRQTRFAYDTLGRLVRTTLPAVDGESPAPVEETRYDDAARTRTTVDALGRQTVEVFDREGRPVERRNPAGGTRVLAWDAAGNKALESLWYDATTPRRDVTFAYDAAGRLARRTEPLGRVTEYAYDPMGNLVRETLLDATDNGFAPRVTEHSYDGLNRRIETRRTVEGGPAVHRTRYDDEDRPVESVDPLGRSTFVTYDELGREIERSEPPWRIGERRVTRFVYDPAGNVLEERLDNDPSPRVRTHAWDALGRRIRSTDGTGGTTHFEYDAVGNPLRRIDPRLDVVSWTYDARDRRTAEIVHLDRVSQPARRATTTFTYDAVGNRMAETWPNGNRVEHFYDALDRVVESRDTLGLLSRFEYDARGNRTASETGEGHRTTTAYDALDRAVEQVAPLGRTTRWTWDVAGNRLTETDPRGHTTRWTYDRLERPVSETDTLGQTATSTWDLAGNRRSRTDRRGHTTRFEYDALDRLARTVDPAPLGTDVTRAYDALDQVVREVDRRGVVTETVRDAEGRPVELRRAGVLLERREYDPAGNLRFLTDANGHTTGYEYDERGLRLAENRPLAAVTRWTWDDLGDVVRERDPEGRVTTRTYDLRRRPATETDPSGAVTSWTHDLDGNRVTERRPEGNTWTYAWDAAGRLSSVSDPLGATTSYTYDGNDNRLTHTDANGHATGFEYDPLDRRTARVYPDGSREETSYDPEGHLAQRVDPSGQETTYAYDPLGRETLRSYGAPATPTGDDLASIATLRDGNGNPVEVTETYTGATGTRVTRRTYDAFDRLESETDPDGQRLSYTYDANGNRLSVTDPTGQTTRYAFDALNRTTAVTAPGGITQYAWYRDGRLSEIVYPSGTRSRTTYDAAGRTQEITSTQASSVVSVFAYTYDGNGNRRTQTETRGTDRAETTTYAYDAADRLLQVSYPEKTVTYGYDPVGNRLTELEEDGAGTVLLDRLYAYDDRDRLLSMTDRLSPDGSASFTYDSAGNRRSKMVGSGDATTYLYDTRNRLVEVRESGLLLESYRYDHLGLRTRRSGPEGVVRYVYDDTALLLETDAFGNPLRRYEYGPDRLLSLLESTGERRFYLFDALGSVTDLVSPAGAVEARYVYDAWGNLRRELGASENPFAFTGHRLDRPTGLYYAQQRYYDPELGLFLTEDPFAGEVQNPPSLHRYLYAYQNPTVYVDPTGERPVFTPNEFVRAIEDYERLQAQSSELSSQLNRAAEAGDLRSLRELGRQNLNLRRQLNRARSRVEAGEEFFNDVLVVLEGVEGPEARLETLTRFLLQPENRTGRFHEAVRLATAILGPLECRSALCRRLPNLTDGEMRIIEALESIAGQSALLGLFEIGALSYADDAVRAPSLADDSLRLAATGDEAVPLAQIEARVRPPRAQPSSGSLRNPSGNLDEAAHAARTQPHGATGGVPARATNPVLGKPRVGSALKSDPHHAFPDLVDDFASDAQRFTIPTRGPGGQVVRQSQLLQIEGSLRGRQGVFEWIIDQGQVTHRRFIPGGRVTGSPNQIPGAN